MIEIRRVLVIGAGISGSRIAMICALAGFDVGVQDVAKVGATRRFGS
ncbi:MAG: 3-hydroxyacyl-CoA dehydrogenase NAD-binding domain-containing protein [Streptosporangiaceae bacterium]|jgi:3-hydroxybutyryl-CoA dehydrogenase